MQSAAVDEQGDTLSDDLSRAAALLSSDPPAAEAQALDVLTIAPGQPQALMLITSARRLAGDKAGVREILERLAAENPKLAVVQYELGLILISMGENEKAVECLSKVTAMEPKHPQALRSLARALIQLGRGNLNLAATRTEELRRKFPALREASALFADAERLAEHNSGARGLSDLKTVERPKSADLHYALGVLLTERGDTESAVSVLSRLTVLAPIYAEGWRALGDAQSDARRAEAAASYIEYLRPGIVEFRQLEEAAADNDRLYATESALKQRLDIHPTDAISLWMLAGVAIRLDRYEEAEKLLGQALTFAPGFSAARHMRAGILHRFAMYKEAVDELAPLLEIDPHNTGYLRLKATALLMQSEYQEAVACYRTLIEKEPEAATVWSDYGYTLKTIGQYDQSVAALRRALTLDAGLGDAWWTLASLRRFRFTPDDAMRMRAQLARSDLDRDNRIRIHHALGKALEDERDYRESFEQYARGNALRRERYPYDVNAAAEMLRRTKAVFDRQLFEAGAGGGCKDRAPIFVVGMTRAGSTLVEQILASHSMIEGTKELRIANLLLTRLNDPARSAMPYPELMKSLSTDAFSRLGEEYLTLAKPHRKTDRPFFVDKTPGNFQHLGFIHLMLPHAKIVDARRHPLACGFANFRLYYRYSQNFASDLGDIGDFYRNYIELMAHFDTVLPGKIHRVIYENLVADPEQEVRRLLDYLGLPFEDSCLRFYETERAIFTPSSEQVRQPIFTQGLAQWRHFEPWLDPLKTALGDVLDLYPAVPRFDAPASPPKMQWNLSGRFTV